MGRWEECEIDMFMPLVMRGSHSSSNVLSVVGGWMDGRRVSIIICISFPHCSSQQKKKSMSSRDCSWMQGWFSTWTTRFIMHFQEPQVSMRTFCRPLVTTMHLMNQDYYPSVYLSLHATRNTDKSIQTLSLPSLRVYLWHMYLSVPRPKWKKTKWQKIFNRWRI